MLERSGWWQRYRLPRSVRVGAAVGGKGIVKGASVVRCGIWPVAVSKLHQAALQPEKHEACRRAETARCVWAHSFAKRAYLFA